MQYCSKVVCLYSDPNTAQINPSAARKPRSQIGDVKEKQSKIGYESLHISRRHPIHRIHPKSSNAHRRILKSQRLLWSSKVAHEPESWMFWNADILCIACTNIKNSPENLLTDPSTPISQQTQQLQASSFNRLHKRRPNWCCSRHNTVWKWCSLKNQHGNKTSPCYPMGCTDIGCSGTIWYLVILRSSASAINWQINRGVPLAYKRQHFPVNNG